MTIKTNIKDGRGTNSLAGVSFAGELVVAGFGNSQTKFNAMNNANTAFNFFIPLSKQSLTITSIFFNSPGGPTTIDIYEASSATSTTIDKQILKIVLAGAAAVFTPITLPFGGFILVTEGEFLNAKTDNVTVNMTIAGFYKPIS